MKKDKFNKIVKYVDGTLSESEKEEIERTIFTSEDEQYPTTLNTLIALKKSLDGEESIENYLTKNDKKEK